MHINWTHYVPQYQGNKPTIYSCEATPTICYIYNAAVIKYKFIILMYIHSNLMALVLH